MKQGSPVKFPPMRGQHKGACALRHELEFLLFRNSIKTRRNNIQYPTFSNIMTDLTEFFSVI